MMLGIEEILCEVERDEINEQGLPPGFRFHPTDEELITFYLASKVFSGSFCGVQIAEVDLNRCEPWELPDVAKMGEREWYFFSLRDRKYPTGLRTNRATGAGYWKATGKDREVYSSTSLVGMKKTLVFYKGRAPRGEKTKWVMHEYRLDGDFSCRHTAKDEWVICRIFHKMMDKKIPSILQGQNYLIKPTPLPTTTATATSSNSLPPLLEPPLPPPPALESHHHQENQHSSIIQTLNQDLQNPFLMNHLTPDQSDLKTLINPLLITQNDQMFNFGNNISLLPTSSSTTNKPNNFLTHQDFTFKELSNAIAKQYCKKEATFETHFPFLSDHGFVSGNIQENGKYPNPFDLLGLSGGNVGENMGIASSTVTGVDHNIHAMDAAAIGHVMSTEPAFRWW